MGILFIVISSVIAYYFSLVYITKKMFEKNGIKLSLSLSLFIPIYIFKTHIVIAWEMRYEKKKSAYVMKTFFLAFNIPLIILIKGIEFTIENSTSRERAVRNERANLFERIRDILHSNSTRNEYQESLAYCNWN